MYKVSLRVNDRVSVQAEGITVKETFFSLAQLTEAFGENKCGVCKGTDLSFRVRKTESDGEKYEFPELVCNNPACRAKLTYGQAKTGEVLYPKRVETTKKGQPVRDENGKVKYLPNNGWSKFEPEEKKEG